MLGNVATVLQQLAQSPTTGTFVTAIATIAIAVIGFLWPWLGVDDRQFAGVRMKQPTPETLFLAVTRPAMFAGLPFGCSVEILFITWARQTNHPGTRHSDCEFATLLARRH